MAGDFVRPGGTVGLLLGCTVVGLPGGVLGDPVVGVLGATVVGTTVGVADGVRVAEVLVGVEVGVGVLVGSFSRPAVGVTALGRTD
ncbi:hypothetical protein AB0F43_10320 [Kribbella sp. NPDC023972]|uniref:hypothetical protein n=1 Tax=Kribbella sp. NPDC023972 TaxID=3154795 RepID=UPI0033F372A4